MYRCKHLVHELKNLWFLCFCICLQPKLATEGWKELLHIQWMSYWMMDGSLVSNLFKYQFLQINDWNVDEGLNPNWTYLKLQPISQKDMLYMNVIESSGRCLVPANKVRAIAQGYLSKDLMFNLPKNNSLYTTRCQSQCAVVHYSIDVEENWWNLRVSSKAIKIQVPRWEIWIIVDKDLHLGSNLFQFIKL